MFQLFLTSVKKLLVPVLLSGFMVQFALTGCTSSESSSAGDGPEALIMKTSADNFVVVSVETGKEISNIPFQSTGLFSEVSDGMFWEEIRGEYWLHSAKEPSTPIIGLPFKNVTAFAAGRAVVGDGISPVKIIDTEGKVVKELPGNIAEVYPFSNDGLAAFRDSQTGLCGYLDINGDIKIKPEYNYANAFSEGYAVVQLGDGEDVDCYLIDKSGKRILRNDGFYFFADKVSSGVIPTCSYAEEPDVDEANPTIDLTYVKPTGEKVIAVSLKQENDEIDTTIGAVDNCVVFCNEYGKYGVKKLDGTTVLNCNYDGVKIITSEVFLVCRNYDKAIIGPGDKIIDGYCSYPSGFQVIGNGRYVKYAPNPQSSREQLYAGPGGDPVVIKANGYSIYDAKGKRLSDVYESWANRLPAEISGPVRYTNIAKVFDPVVGQISIDKVFGFGESTSMVDVARRFGWVEDENIQSNFRWLTKEYYYELPDGEYQLIDMIFSEDMVSPKTHKETRGTGWMSYEEEVVDGYGFNPNAILQWIEVEFNDLAGASTADVMAMLIASLKNKGFKVTEDVSKGGTHSVTLKLDEGNRYVKAKTIDLNNYVKLEISLPASKS